MLSRVEGTTNRGSYFGKKFEFRITQRCLVEDLGAEADSSFDDVREAAMVGAMIRDRAVDPDGGKTVGPAAGKKTLRRLSHGERDRGVTWWDSTNGIVWLCAAHANHRSGEDDDSFRYFDQLIADKRIYPTEGDYERLLDEREMWFYDFAARDAQTLLEAARAHQGAEIRGVVGGDVPAGVVVEVVDTAEETFVLVKWEDIPDLDMLQTLLAGFYPGTKWDDWDSDRPFTLRELEPGERAWCYVKW